VTFPYSGHQISGGSTRGHPEKYETKMFRVFPRTQPAYTYKNGIAL
jgi:hypothetical protein